MRKNEVELQLWNSTGRDKLKVFEWTIQNCRLLNDFLKLGHSITKSHQHHHHQPVRFIINHVIVSVIHRWTINKMKWEKRASFCTTENSLFNSMFDVKIGFECRELKERHQKWSRKKICDSVYAGCASASVYVSPAIAIMLAYGSLSKTCYFVHVLFHGKEEKKNSSSNNALDTSILFLYLFLLF